MIEEIPKSRQCYLEDELGDVLWDYLNILTALEKEQGIESGKRWADIKAQQKAALAIENDLNTNN